MTVTTTGSDRVAGRGVTGEPGTRTRLLPGPAVTPAPATRARHVPGPPVTPVPAAGARPGSDPIAGRKSVNFKRLVADLRALGVPAARPLIVHASLSRIGHVRGGAETVIDALLEVVGPTGTLVTGAGTPENSTTSRAFLARTARLGPDALEQFRAKMPAFDRASTPTSVGAIAEVLRKWPGAQRSAHPQSSFAAVGREAKALMAGHRVRCHLGEASPLAKLYDRDAMVLMLGVGYLSCSAFHLAEYRYRKHPPLRDYSCVVKKWGKHRWFRYRDVVLDDGDFETIGKHLKDVLEDEGTMLSGHVGLAESHLIPIRRVVDLASEWMGENRSLEPAGASRNRPW
ncbi:MAG TPA: AAC(3) family N-acetyltransferase [Trebonia sp.]|jgi:aminoglycoside 3-N-acetyltransferase